MTHSTKSHAEMRAEHEYRERERRKQAVAEERMRLDSERDERRAAEISAGMSEAQRIRAARPKPEPTREQVYAEICAARRGIESCSEQIADLTRRREIAASDTRITELRRAVDAGFTSAAEALREAEARLASYESPESWMERRDTQRRALEAKTAEFAQRFPPTALDIAYAKFIGVTPEMLAPDDRVRSESRGMVHLLDGRSVQIYRP